MPLLFRIELPSHCAFALSHELHTSPPLFPSHQTARHEPRCIIASSAVFAPRAQPLSQRVQRVQSISHAHDGQRWRQGLNSHRSGDKRRGQSSRRTRTRSRELVDASTDGEKIHGMGMGMGMGTSTSPARLLRTMPNAHIMPCLGCPLH